MRLKKTVAQLAVLGMGMTGIFSVNATASQVAATADTTFNLTLVPPSCTLTAPSSITLADQKPGTTKDNNTFNLEIACEMGVATKIKASIVKGTQKTDTSMALLNGVADSGAALTLRYNNTDVMLTGNDADTFCAGDQQQRTCVITPRLVTSQNVVYGTASGSVKFDIIYS
ncbi:TPA: hypothetical protein SI540_004586 [Escherichia coli]|nr:hypothetical protein [Escherichia coli]HEI2488329.1 hypothetical protein [Escherichia coli]HEI2493869.1 hypothetical protein [Escherichia coli]HEI2555880.1 hypothetical protein [Escherichia coli]HEI2570396.1 hypothetical protein [Escherichia coli]